MDKGLTLAQWCKALVQRATQVMSAENAFKEWHKGRLSSAERPELEMYRRQAKDGAKAAAAKTSAAVVKFTDNNLNAAASTSGFNGCRRLNLRFQRHLSQVQATGTSSLQVPDEQARARAGEAGARQD